MSTNLNNRSHAGFMRLLALVVCTGLLALSLVLILQNWQNVSLTAFSNTFQIPLAVIDLGCLFVGCIIGYSFNFALSKMRANAGRKLEWQAQDAKLAASIVSDKEKQLEAKIATLETALKNALKKNT